MGNVCCNLSCFQTSFTVCDFRCGVDHSSYIREHTTFEEFSSDIKQMLKGGYYATTGVQTLRSQLNCIACCRPCCCGLLTRCLTACTLGENLECAHRFILFTLQSESDSKELYVTFEKGPDGILFQCSHQHHGLKSQIFRELSKPDDGRNRSVIKSECETNTTHNCTPCMRIRHGVVEDYTPIDTKNKYIPSIEYMLNGMANTDDVSPKYLLFLNNCQNLVTKFTEFLYYLLNDPIEQDKILIDNIATTVKPSYINKFQFVDLPWNPNIQTKLPIEDIYIQLDFKQVVNARENTHGDTDAHISMSDFYRIMKRGDVKRIVIEAPGGSGKTVITKKILADWVRGERYVQEFDLIIRLDVKGIDVKDKTANRDDIIDAIKRQHPKIKSMLLEDTANQSFCKTLLNRQQNIAIVLDGLDEASDEGIEAIQQLYGERIHFEKSQVILTTRSEATQRLKFHGGVVNLYSIRELTREQKEEFIYRYPFIKESTRRKLLQEYENLQNNRQICKTPLDITMCCALYDDEIISKDVGSQADFYNCIIALSLKSELLKTHNEESLTSYARQHLMEANTDDMMNDYKNKVIALAVAFYEAHQFRFDVYNAVPISDLDQVISKLGVNDVDCKMLFRLAFLEAIPEISAIQTRMTYKTYHPNIQDSLLAYGYMNQPDLFKQLHPRKSDKGIIWEQAIIFIKNYPFVDKTRREKLLADYSEVDGFRSICNIVRSICKTPFDIRMCCILYEYPFAEETTLERLIIDYSELGDIQSFCKTVCDIRMCAALYDDKNMNDRITFYSGLIAFCLAASITETANTAPYKEATRLKHSTSEEILITYSKEICVLGMAFYQYHNYQVHNYDAVDESSIRRVFNENGLKESFNWIMGSAFLEAVCDNSTGTNQIRYRFHHTGVQDYVISHSFIYKSHFSNGGHKGTSIENVSIEEAKLFIAAYPFSDEMKRERLLNHYTELNDMCCRTRLHIRVWAAFYDYDSVEKRTQFYSMLKSESEKASSIEESLDLIIIRKIKDYAEEVIANNFEVISEGSLMWWTFLPYLLTSANYLFNEINDRIYSGSNLIVLRSMMAHCVRSSIRPEVFSDIIDTYIAKFATNRNNTYNDYNNLCTYLAYFYGRIPQYREVLESKILSTISASLELEIKVKGNKRHFSGGGYYGHLYINFAENTRRFSSETLDYFRDYFQFICAHAEMTSVCDVCIHPPLRHPVELDPPSQYLDEVWPVTEDIVVNKLMMLYASGCSILYFPKLGANHVTGGYYYIWYDVKAP